jgi:hypothetical protein
MAVGSVFGSKYQPNRLIENAGTISERHCDRDGICNNQRWFAVSLATSNFTNLLTKKESYVVLSIWI